MNSNVQISVIIPTYNRTEQLKRCLTSLQSQNCPKDLFEIIVVDGGSRDNNLREIVSPTKCNIRYLRQTPNKGVGAARNLGIRYAKGDIIAFIDDDCIAQQDWVEKIIQYFKRFPGEDIIQGAIQNADKSAISIALQYVIDRFIYKGLIQDNAALRCRHFLTTGGAIKKDVFRKIGLFDESFKLSEDADFYYRIKLYKKNILYAPEAIIKHCHRKAIRAMLMQQFNFGRYSYLLKLKWSNVKFPENRAEIIKYRFSAFKRIFKKTGLVSTIYIIFISFFRKLVYRLGYIFERVKFSIK